MTLLAFSALFDAITSLTLGGFVLFHRPRDPVSRAWAYLMLSIAVFSLAQCLREVAPSMQFARFWGGNVLFSAVIAIYITFPHFANQLAKNKMPRLLRIAFAGLMVVFLVLVNLTNLVIRPQMLPKGAFRFYNVPGPLYPLVTSFYLVTTVYGITILYRRYRCLSSERERNQMLYMILACIIGFGGGSMNFLVDFDINLYPFGNYLIPIYSAVISYAIVKYRLLDVTVIIRKTLVYSSVTGALTMMYLGIIALFARLFEGLAGAQTIFSSAVAAGLITLCFQPLRKRVQAFVDVKFFRQYVDREEKLYELSREVITHTSMEAMAGAMMRVLGETLYPKAGALYLRSAQSEGYVPAARWGNQSLQQMPEDNALALYFVDHPQPFVQDAPAEVGSPRSTRNVTPKSRNES